MRRIIAKARNWPVLMRQTWENEDEVQTTPFREMIRCAPGLIIFSFVTVVELPIKHKQSSS